MRHFGRILDIVILFFIISPNLLLSQNITKGINKFYLLNIFHKLVPSPLILLDEDNDSYVILVEKRSQRLYVLNNVKSSIVIENSYLCSTGKIRGDKQELGDNKTPEGIYFLHRKIDSSTLSAKYGAGAFVLDYPNSFDKIRRKNGYGIWIHGTNEPERLENTNDTRGCVILKNEDFMDLSQYIILNKTPVIIVNEVQYRKVEYVDKDRREISGFLENWKNSWESKKISEYINHYSKNFRHKKMNIRSYRSYKKRLFRRYKWIKLHLSNIQIFRDQQYVLINFLQEYSADTFSDFGVKQLFLINENNTYKITKERWSEIQN